jgi:hypothetical protein
MLYVHHDRSFSSSRNQHTDGSSTSSRVVDVEDVLLEDVKLDMLHHTCTRLSLCGPDGTTRVMVYGGRYSPRRAVNAWPIILSVLSWDVGPRLTVASSNTAARDEKHAPVPRWRHSAVCLKSSTPTPTQDYVVVFGGRTLDFRVSLTITFWCNIFTCGFIWLGNLVLHIKGWTRRVFYNGMPRRIFIWTWERWSDRKLGKMYEVILS